MANMNDMHLIKFFMNREKKKKKRMKPNNVRKIEIQEQGSIANHFVWQTKGSLLKTRCFGNNSKCKFRFNSV